MSESCLRMEMEIVGIWSKSERGNNFQMGDKVMKGRRRLPELGLVWHWVKCVSLGGTIEPNKEEEERHLPC